MELLEAGRRPSGSKDTEAYPLSGSDSGVRWKQIPESVGSLADVKVRRASGTTPERDEWHDIECLIERLLENLTTEQRHQAMEFIRSDTDVFSRSEFDIERTEIIRHTESRSGFHQLNLEAGPSFHPARPATASMPHRSSLSVAAG